MTVVTLRTPTYTSLADSISNYGQAGGPTQHQFFSYAPGPTIELEPGANASRGAYDQLAVPQTPETPGLLPSLAGAGAQYLANRAGVNAGNYAYEQMMAGKGIPSFGETIVPGIKATGREITDFFTGVGDTFSGVGDIFTGSPPPLDPSGFTITDGVAVSNSILGPAPALPEMSTTFVDSLGNITQATPVTSTVATPTPTTYTTNTGYLADPVDSLSGMGGTTAPLDAAGNVITASPGTPMWSGGDFGTNLRFGGMQSGLFGGAVTLGLGLLMGQDFKTAAKSAAGSGIGTAIGYAVGGPIGGFIGGTLGSAFCFTAGTQIEMFDGTTKDVADLIIGDRVFLGGEVQGTGQVLCDDIYEYKGTFVSGSHAVFEYGFWLRVRDSEHATPVSIDKPVVVIPVATEKCLLVTNGFVSADFNEVAGSQYYNENERLEILNSCYERNEEIVSIELPNRKIQSQGSLFDNHGLGQAV